MWKEQDGRRTPVSLIDELERIAGQQSADSYEEIKGSFYNVLRTNEVIAFQDSTGDKLVKVGAEPNSGKIVAPEYHYPTPPQPLKGWEKVKSTVMRWFNSRSDGDLRYERELAEYHASRPQEEYHERMREHLDMMDEREHEPNRFERYKREHMNGLERDRDGLRATVRELEQGTAPARERTQLRQTQLMEEKAALLQRQQTELDEVTQDMGQNKARVDEKYRGRLERAERGAEQDLQKADAELLQLRESIAKIRNVDTKHWTAGVIAVAANREQRREDLKKQPHQKEQKENAQGEREKTVAKEEKGPSL